MKEFVSLRQTRNLCHRGTRRLDEDDDAVDEYGKPVEKKALTFILVHHSITKTCYIPSIGQIQSCNQECAARGNDLEGNIRVGTSGWSYPHWKEVFYPANCPTSKWLECYAEHFDTVELNATFYRLPQVSTFKGWKRRTPDNFLWAVKANKYITHTKRLKEPKESLERFYSAALVLEEKLGPILFQLPPSLTFKQEEFEVFCQCLCSTKRHSLEVRHPSWITDRCFAILEKYNIAFCIADSAGRYPFHEAGTADFIYVRLHGSKRLYASEYGEEELQGWAQKIKDWGKDTYLYFDNDFQGNAVKNAKRLKEILGLS